MHVGKGWTIAWLTALLMTVALPAMANMTVTDEVNGNKLKLDVYGFSQFEIRGGDAFTSEGGPFFQAQRIRVGFNYFRSPVAGKLFLDFNQSHTSDEGGLPKMIKDAFVAYRFDNAVSVRLGMIKTPLGMAFTVPGWNLDNVERSGLDKGLVLERDFGLMVSGRLIGQESQPEDKWMKTNGLEMGTERQGYGFGYDVGVFNPAGRSSAVIWDKKVLGDALAYAGRVHYDYGKLFHVEAAGAISEKAGGSDTLATEDYTVFDVGAASEYQKFELKGEFVYGTNIRGVKDWKQNCIALTAGYMVHDQVQAMVKHYQASSERPGKDTYNLGNTYIGANFYLAPVSGKARDLQRCKIVVNYILATGDKEDWSGIGGYTDDGYVVQWQYKF